MTKLTVSPNCLVIFVDETGHETLVKGHPVYGLGGCAVLGKHLDQVIRAPWRAVRQAVAGSQDAALHASSFSRSATGPQIQAVAKFFQSQAFSRIGAIVSFRTSLPDELGPLPAIARVLQQRIVDIARWTSFDSIAIIFESSQRADPLIKAAFQGVAVQEDGKPVTVDCYFMPKSAGEPALEVADFIMHSIGRQARHNLTKRGTFVPDFKAVFHGIERRLVSYIEVSTIELSEQPAASDANQVEVDTIDALGIERTANRL